MNNTLTAFEELVWTLIGGGLLASLVVYGTIIFMQSL